MPSADVESFSECVRLLESTVQDISSNIQSSTPKEVVLSQTKKKLAQLCLQVHESLEEACNQWANASKGNRLAVLTPGSKVLIGLLNTDAFAIEHDISTKKKAADTVHSQRFSMSESAWDHPYDMYLSGTVVKLLWSADQVASGTPLEHQGYGPYALVELDPVSQEDSNICTVFPINRCCPFDRHDEFSAPRIGEYCLLYSNGVYEPIKLLEVEHAKDSACPKSWAFQYKSKKILRASTSSLMVLKTGHSSTSCPTALFGLGCLLADTPTVLAGVARTSLAESDRDAESSEYAEVVAAIWQEMCVAEEKTCVLSVGSMLQVALAKVTEWVESGGSNRGATVSDASTLLTAYGQPASNTTGKLHGNHADAVLGSAERTQDRKCRDAFRMLEDIAFVLTMMLRSHSVGVLEQKLMLRFFEFCDLCTGPLLDSFCSLPFEVSTREWCSTTCGFLRTQTAVRSLLTSIGDDLSGSEVYGHIQRVSTSLEGIIADRCDIAVAQMSRVCGSFLLDEATREDWDSHAPYRRGKKVSAGIVAVGMTYRGFLRDAMTTLRLHGEVTRALCTRLLTASIRSILDTYSAIVPSRVRAGQLRLDLSAAFFTAMASVEALENSGALLGGKKSLDVAEAVMDCDEPICYVCNLQRASLLHYATRKIQNQEPNQFLQDTLSGIDFFSFETAQETPRQRQGTASTDGPKKELTEVLLELATATFIHTAAANDMQHFISTATVSPKSSQSTSPLASDVSMENLSSLLNLSEVKGRSDRLPSISDIVQWVSMTDAVSRGEREESDPPFKATADLYERSLKYDSITDMDVCCGNNAEPSVSVSGAKIKVYSKVDKSCLNHICVNSEWLSSQLKCRPEMCDSEYPPLSEEETELASRITSFISSMDIDESSMSATSEVVWNS